MPPPATQLSLHPSDILEAARAQHGLERLEPVKSPMLEIGGSVGIVPKKER